MANKEKKKKNEALRSIVNSVRYIWQDRRHHLWFPWSFTRYMLSDDRIFCETGFFNTHSDEILLYRIRDLQLSISLWQRLFGTGTVVVLSSDKTTSRLELKNVKHPREVKELIHQHVESAKNDRRMRPMEIMGDGGDADDANIADEAENG